MRNKWMKIISVVVIFSMLYPYYQASILVLAAPAPLGTRLDDLNGSNQSIEGGYEPTFHSAFQAQNNDCEDLPSEQQKACWALIESSQSLSNIEAIIEVNGSPISFNINDDTRVAVYHNGVKQFYDDDAEGVFLWVNGQVFGPNVDAGNTMNPYTLVSNTLSGDGSSINPWRVRTVVDVGTTGLQLWQSVEYTNGEPFLKFTWNVINTTGSNIPYTLFHAADLYTENNDDGYGYYDPETGAIGGYTVDFSFYQYFQPIIPASHFFEGSYLEVWNLIGDYTALGSGFDDTYVPNEEIDNGAGLQWDRNVSAGDTDTVADYLVFNTQIGLGELVNPENLNFGYTGNQIYMSITPRSASDSWTLTESLDWLQLSQVSGLGESEVSVVVDRAGLADGNYSGQISAIVSGETVPVGVSMDVAVPQVTILAPYSGSTAFQNGTLLVRADVTVGGSPAYGAQVSGEIDLPGPGSMVFDLYDDGNHEDGDAYDGVYGSLTRLYGSLMMPTSGNPYPLVVSADLFGLVGSDNIYFNVTPSYGAPTVSVSYSGPNAPDYFAGDAATVTAALTFPDASVHNDTEVVLHVRRPDGNIIRVTLTNIANNVWQGTYTFPTMAGHYYLDVRAGPPEATNYVDGWGTGSPAPYIYRGPLDIVVNTDYGPWPRNSAVPMEVCVSSGGPMISGAIVEALFTSAPVGEDGPRLFEGDTPGCYTANYHAFVSGTYVVSYNVSHSDYKPNSASGSFSISTSESGLPDEVESFSSQATNYMDQAIFYVQRAAQDGDYFKYLLKIDRAELLIDFICDLLSVAAAGLSAADIHWITIPGYGLVEDEYAELFIVDSAIKTVEVGSEIIAHRITALPMTFYAREGELENEFEGEITQVIEEKYAEMIPLTGSLERSFSDVLKRKVVVAIANINNEAADVIALLPGLSFTVDEEQAYMEDMVLRDRANSWLGYFDLEYQTDFLHENKLDREADEANYWDDVLQSIAEFIVKVLILTFLGSTGPLALVAAQSLFTYIHAVQNNKEISEDQLMRDNAIGLMNAGFRSETITYLNTLSALSLISQAEDPETPQGEMTSINLVRTTDLLFFTHDVYADVTIHNSGSVNALYGVKAYYRDTDNKALACVEGMEDVGSGEMTSTVELSSGESRTVRIYLKKKGEFDYGRPQNGDLIRFNLYAYSPKGAWLPDEEPDLVYQPSLESQVLRLQAEPGRSTPYVDGVLEAAIVNPEDDLSYPIYIKVGTSEDGLDYSLRAYITNPYPEPVAALITQTIPPEVMVQAIIGEGVMDGTEMTWMVGIQPRETVVVGYDFTYSLYDTEVNLPPMNVSFDLVGGATTATFSEEPAAFTAKIPFHATANAEFEVTTSTDQTVEVNVENRDTTSPQSGELELKLISETGTVVHQDTIDINLGAGASGVYNFNYIAPPPGLYLLEVTLVYGATQVRVIADVLKSNPLHHVYLPITVNGAVNVSDLMEGSVTDGGIPVDNTEIELIYFNGSSFEFYATTTDNNGYYQFSNLPALGNDQFFYVRWYNNDSDSSRLSKWVCLLVKEGSDPSLYTCNFDLQNIDLVLPSPGANISLPYTFQWSTRSLYSDDYELNIADMADTDPWWWTDPPLGYVDSYTLNGLPSGFIPGEEYGWWMWVYGTNGYGVSYYAYIVTFLNAGTISQSDLMPTSSVMDKEGIEVFMPTIRQR